MDDCPTSHLEADGQLVDVFPATYSPNTFRIVTKEIFLGIHVVFDPMILTCPTCYIYIARPFDPQNLPRTTPPRKSELALNRRHQRQESL